MTAVSPADVETIRLQLGRPPRGTHAVAHRCACGAPDVVETAPRLPDGTPFPTVLYLTCPRAASRSIALRLSSTRTFSGDVPAGSSAGRLRAAESSVSVMFESSATLR